MDEKIIWALRINAIKAVEDPSDSDLYDRICRWFSKEFHIPLPQVEDMPYEYVLKHYFADKYSTLSSGDDAAVREYEKERNILLFPEEIQDLGQKDDEWVEKLKKEMEEQSKKTADTISGALEEAMNQALADQPNIPNLNGDIPDNLKLPESGDMSEE